MAIIKQTTNEDVEKMKCLCTVDGVTSCYSHYGKQFGGYPKELRYDPSNLILGYIYIYIPPKNYNQYMEEKEAPQCS